MGGCSGSVPPVKKRRPRDSNSNCAVWAESNEPQLKVGRHRAECNPNANTIVTLTRQPCGYACCLSPCDAVPSAVLQSSLFAIPAAKRRFIPPQDPANGTLTLDGLATAWPRSPYPKCGGVPSRGFFCALHHQHHIHNHQHHHHHHHHGVFASALVNLAPPPPGTDSASLIGSAVRNSRAHTVTDTPAGRLAYSPPAIAPATPRPHSPVRYPRSRPGRAIRSRRHLVRSLPASAVQYQGILVSHLTLTLTLTSTAPGATYNVLSSVPR